MGKNKLGLKWVGFKSQFNDLLSNGLGISLDLSFIILKMGMIMEPKSKVAVMINKISQIKPWAEALNGCYVLINY